VWSLFRFRNRAIIGEQFQEDVCIGFLV
jgi:hypothetical protein